MPTFDAPEDVAGAKQSLAEVVARSYIAFTEALVALPLFLDNNRGDRGEYIVAMKKSGATFAHDLAGAIILGDDLAQISAPEDPLPKNLPRLIGLLLAGFVLFSAIGENDDLSRLEKALPSLSEMKVSTDPVIVAWIQKFGNISLRV